MTTTTGDPSTLKNPASLSGGDLVSRLLAATPPYLYNMPITSHSFFFSEMLRSFVQAKTEASSSVGTPSAPRRRKRSWRDARDRPLELTTKERPQHNHQASPEKFFHSQAATQQQEPLQEVLLDRSKDTYEVEKLPGFEQKPHFVPDILKSTEEAKLDFSKHPKNYFDERPHQQYEQSDQASFPKLRRIKPEESGERKSYERNFDNTPKLPPIGQEMAILSDQKKVDFPRNFLPGLPGREEVLQGVKGFGMPGNATNQEFLPGPLWYPPYPMPHSYPGIDPLHFFIDLRVSGHIWDRKMNERQLSFKSKHCSAFSVPQSKEFSNRPLNLTRDEATTSRNGEENTRGTNYILKHLTRTYKDIRQGEKTPSESTDNEEQKESEVERSPKREESGGSSANNEEERKDLRALIGLELVVDYVKEPKGNPPIEHTLQVTE
ncbi:uncharacterized protein [Prorops nasuta]|uniref:uncharacterized protein n=1 Tax=Prorops nasuta TaxID=863751 RepID=UPI0034CFA0D7